MDIGWPELLIVLAVAVVLFGSRRLPDLARALGESVTELKKGLRGDGEEKDEKPD